MNSWKRLGQTVVSRVGHRVIISKFFELPNGSVHHFETTNEERWQGASVLALTEDNRAIVVRQFRPGPEKMMDELPGGMVDEGEDKEAAAWRELLEETGYEAGSIRFLGTMYYDAYVNGDRHCFLATDCKPVEGGAESGEHEFIELKLISIDELLENARRGRLTDPGTILLAYDELQKRRGRI